MNISLENILIDKDNKVSLIDFYSSCDAEFDKRNLLPTENVEQSGPKGYSSPEVYYYFYPLEKLHYSIDNNSLENFDADTMSIDKNKKMQVKDNNISDKSKFDPWKADVYSSGILGLILSNEVKLNEPGLLDHLKINESLHQNIENFVNKSEWEDENGPN